MRPPLDPVLDPTPADWIVEGRWPWGHLGGMRVGVLVPPIFDSYCRVFHPALKGGELVRWADVAAQTGRTMHPEAQFFFLAGGDPAADNPHVSPPVAGISHGPGSWSTVPGEQKRALLDVLTAGTVTPHSCWICEWNGHGYLSQEVASRQAVVRAQNRRYLLDKGTIQDVLRFPSGPDIWWPPDRAWLVSTDTDLDSTFVGGDRVPVDAILGSRDLEALEVSPDTRFDINGDRINAPGRPMWIPPGGGPDEEG